MGYRIDANYEIDAIVMNRTPDNCEVCPFYGYSLKEDDMGCCIILDMQMTNDNAWRGRRMTCPIKSRSEMEAQR